VRQMEILFDREKKILELDTRRKIYDVVNESPGCHFREIERRSGLTTGSVKHHLDFLARNGLIKVEKKDQKLRYYPNSFTTDNKKLMALLRQKSIRNILITIMTCSNCNHIVITKKVKLSASTVSWHLKKLEDADVIEPIKKGRKTYYKLTVNRDEIVKLLIIYRESFFDSLVDRVVEMWDI